MDDLVGWLREQIKTDAITAQAALERGSQVYDWAYLRDLGIGLADATYLGRAHPRTALARCQAHTAILDAYDHQPEEGLRHAVLSLALAYQHHPGYRAEWRPS